MFTRYFLSTTFIPSISNLRVLPSSATSMVSPSAKFVCALADAFECSADYILGREDDFGNVNVMRELTEDEKLWLGLYSKLSNSQRKEAENFVGYLLSKI